MTSADKLFDSLKASDKLMQLSTVLRPAQMMFAMQIVTAAMGNKPAPEQAVRALLRSFDDDQLERLRGVLTKEQSHLLAEAVNEYA
jgi:hypothetical protein